MMSLRWGHVAILLGEDRVFSSADDVTCFSPHYSNNIGTRSGHHRVDSSDGSEEQKDVQEEVPRGTQYLVSLKGNHILNDPVESGRVACGVQNVDGIGQEVDNCIRLEGGLGGASVELLQVGEGSVPHAREVCTKGLANPGGVHEVTSGGRLEGTNKIVEY